jgi:hypothetical protein
MIIAPHKPWYKMPLVWLLITIPLSAVIAGIATAIIAFKTDDGLVKDDYYTYGKQINKVIKRDKVAESIGLSAALHFDYEASTVTTMMNSTTGYDLPAAISVEFLHATRAGNDRMVTLQRTPQGNYFSILPALVDGHWIVQLSAENWRLSGHLYVPGKSDIVITAIK